MSTQTKAPGGYPGASKTCHSRAARQVQYPIKSSENQLVACLKKHRAKLLACEFSREISADLDCVDHLLDRVKTQGGC